MVAVSLSSDPQEVTVQLSTQTVNVSVAIGGVRDDKVKITLNDTTPGYLGEKLVAGSSKISLTTVNPAGDEDLSIDVVESNLTITASQVSDFDTEVSNNTDVAANTLARHDAVTVTDTSTIDLTLTGQDIKGDVIVGAVDHDSLLNVHQDVNTTASPTFAGLTVDTNTLFVDNVNNRVGIGTLTPTYSLDVIGVTSTNSLHIDGTDTANTGFTLSAETGYKRIQTFGGQNLSINPLGNNVGIGTIAPGAKLEIEDDGTNIGCLIDMNGNNIALSIDSEATSTAGLTVVNGAIHTSSGGTSIVNFASTNSSSSGTVLNVDNAGTGNGLFIDQNGNGIALNIDSESTSNPAISLSSKFGYSSTFNVVGGYAGFFSSDGTATASPSNGVVRVRNTTVADTSPTLFVENLSTGNGLFIDQNGNGIGLFIDSEATNNQAAIFQSVSTIQAVNIRSDSTGIGLIIDQNGNGIALNVDSEATSQPLITLSAINGNSRGDIAFNTARTGDPSAPAEGDIWYNSTSHEFKGYNGTSVVILG